MIDEKYILRVLEKLVNTASPSGYTAQAMKLVENELAALGIKAEYTAKGALSAIVKGQEENTVRTLAAHVDTLGGMVKEIKDNGRLLFTQVGGFMPHSVECENCFIHTADGRTYTGTIYTTKPSVHVHADSKSHERSMANMEILLDEKVLDADQVKGLGIEIGDFISFDPRFKVTEKGFVKTRHLDDKASVAILLGVLKAVVENKIKPKQSLQLFISNYEEVGHGASFGIDSRAVELLCVDMGAPGEGQNTDEYTVSICAKDSSGPYDFEFRNTLVRLAKENNIGYKLDIYPFYGSDGSAALRAGAGLKVGLVGPGVYASHSYERTHIESLMNTARLVLEYIKD